MSAEPGLSLWRAGEGSSFPALAAGRTAPPGEGKEGGEEVGVRGETAWRGGGMLTGQTTIKSVKWREQKGGPLQVLCE